MSDKPPFVEKSLTVYYKHHVGAYKNVGKFLEAAMKMMPESAHVFGIYYDNPSVSLLCC